MDSSELKANIIECLENEKCRMVLLTIYTHETKLRREKGNDFWGWKTSELGLSPYWRILQELVMKGILKLVYKSRKNTIYRLADYDKVSEAITAYITGKEKEEKEAETVDMEAEAYNLLKQYLDVLVGYDDLKELLLMSVKTTGVNLLFLGPGGVGKSVILTAIGRLPGSYYFTGGEASRAGIAQVVREYMPRYLLIDEFDKISDVNQYSILYSLADRGELIETKARRINKVKLRITIYAAANRLDRIRSSKPELLDRFNIIRFRPYTVEEAYKVTVAYLSRIEGVPAEIAEYIAEKIIIEEKVNTVRRALSMWNLVKPLHEEGKDVSEIKKAIDKYHRIFKKYGVYEEAKKIYEGYVF